MAPEYAMEGLFSVKSDVYSFGVLLLEIVSGRRNTSFRLEENSSLIEHAWNLWNEGKAMDLVDPNIRDSSSQNQVLRCIHVGMLCVQDSAMYRPTMASVVLMLESETPTLPVPRQPTFTSMRSSVDAKAFKDLGNVGPVWGSCAATAQLPQTGLNWRYRATVVIEPRPGKILSVVKARMGVTYTLLKNLASSLRFGPSSLKKTPGSALITSFMTQPKHAKILFVLSLNKAHAILFLGRLYIPKCVLSIKV
ncbi:hypothetical protein WN943_012320 [Citrus x changshan-huyou]